MSSTSRSTAGFRHNEHIDLDSDCGELIHEFMDFGHNDFVTTVAFSPDGTRVVTGSREGRAILWDTATGKILREFGGRVQAIFSIAFSPDKQRLLTAHPDDTAILWDLTVGKRLCTIEAGRRLTSIAFSPDGKSIVSGSYEGTTFWNADTQEKIRTFEGHPATTPLSADGKTVLTQQYQWDGDWTILWDAESGERLWTLTEKDLTGNAFSADGKKLLVGYRDGRIDVWDVATKAKLYSLQGEGWIEAIATSSDGTRIVGGSHLAKLFVWSADTHELIRTLEGHHARINTVALGPDGKQILSGAFESNVILWDAETGKQLRTLPTRASSTSCVLFSPDGKSAIAGNSAGMTIWDVDSDNELGQLIVFDEENWLVVTPDGHFDGSPEGIRRVTFLSDDRLSVTPADKVDPALFQPGLLAKLLKREQP